MPFDLFAYVMALEKNEFGMTEETRTNVIAGKSETSWFDYEPWHNFSEK